MKLVTCDAVNPGTVTRDSIASTDSPPRTARLTER